MGRLTSVAATLVTALVTATAAAAERASCDDPGLNQAQLSMCAGLRELAKIPGLVKPGWKQRLMYEDSVCTDDETFGKAPEYIMTLVQSGSVEIACGKGERTKKITRPCVDEHVQFRATIMKTERFPGGVRILASATNSAFFLRPFTIASLKESRWAMVESFRSGAGRDEIVLIASDEVASEYLNGKILLISVPERGCQKVEPKF